MADEPAIPRGADEIASELGGPLPDVGAGALDALDELAAAAARSATRSSGPRFFHFVTGGVTPAALGADWLASALDQNAFGWTSSPLAGGLESVALDWLKELFGLPASWGGVLTTGATAANLTGLAAARRWCAQQHGVDVDADGLAGAPRIPVYAGGYVHASARKALAVLGLGRDAVQVLSRDDVGRFDLDALEHAVSAPGGAPAIVIATAGEVNAGDFDPVADLADLTERYGAWLHVDGAFGLFARVTPAVSHLADGVDRADSVIADGHKWLNVPYDCGFAFVRDPALLSGPFGLQAAYLGESTRPSYGLLGPEMSRRARSLAVWTTLRAYGRAGYRELVERHLELARRVGAQVEAASDLELLADVKLNVVCFRYRPPGVAEEELDALNLRLGELVLQDGRIAMGTTSYGGRVAFRPAISNWRTTEADVDLIVQVVRELASGGQARA
jgi:glutamate/tyrosine decarboxylase-like PLP-dependent enzyme